MARLVELHPTCHSSVYNSRVRAHSQKVFEELASVFEIFYAWGIGATGDHSEGKALDLMAYSKGGGINSVGAIRPGWNERVRDYLLKHHGRLGVRYFIYDRIIISSSSKAVTGVEPWAPKAYTGTSHANHVHISFFENPPAYKPLGGVEPEEDILATKAELKEVVQALFEDFAPRYAKETWKQDLKLSATQAAITGSQEGRALSASVLLRGSWARSYAAHAAVRNDIPQILAGVAKLGGPMSAEERAALADEIGSRVDKLRIVLDLEESV